MPRAEGGEKDDAAQRFDTLRLFSGPNNAESGSKRSGDAGTVRKSVSTRCCVRVMGKKIIKKTPCGCVL